MTGVELSTQSDFGIFEVFFASYLEVEPFGKGSGEAQEKLNYVQIFIVRTNIGDLRAEICQSSSSSQVTWLKG